MKIVILDATALNPGDLSYECINQFGDVTIYDRTETEADTIERIGFERAQELLLSNELLERKNEILGLNVVGGATC